MPSVIVGFVSAAFSETFTVDGLPSFGVIVISESFACFGTSIEKFPLSSDVTFFSVPSFNLIVTSVFGLVFPLTFVVSFDGSFSALPSVIVGFVSSSFAVVTVLASDLLLCISSAVALNSVEALTLSFGSVITPLVWSIFIEESVPSGSFHSLPSFVAIRVWSFPSLSLYFTVTVFASSSSGGVISIFPSSFTVTCGLSGACSSFAFTVTSSDVFSPAFAVIFTSVSFLILSAGIVISPVFSSIVIDASVPFGSFHLPSWSFSAFKVVGVSLPFGV